MSIVKAVSRVSSSIPVLAAGSVGGFILCMLTLLLLVLVDTLIALSPSGLVILAAIAVGSGAWFLSRALGFPTEVPVFVSAAGFACGFLLPPALFVWVMREGMRIGDLLVPALLLLGVGGAAFLRAYRGAIAARGRRHGPAKEPSCPKCGYSLYYATGRRCPECGRAFALYELDLRLAEWDGTLLLPTQDA